MVKLSIPEFGISLPLIFLLSLLLLLLAIVHRFLNHLDGNVTFLSIAKQHDSDHLDFIASLPGLG